MHLTVSRYEKRSTIFSDKSSSQSAYILLSGVARITCDNRKGRRTLVIMVSPRTDPGVSDRVAGITYNFRCEAITNCEVGTIGLNTLREDLPRDRRDGLPADVREFFGPLGSGPLAQL